MTLSPDDKQCLIMDYVEKGNLHDYLSKNKPEWDVKINMVVNIAEGLLECHDHKIIHPNLCTKKILIDKKLNVKIAGFCSSTSKKNMLIDTKFNIIEVEEKKIEDFNSNTSTKKALKNKKKDNIYDYGIVVLEIAMNGKEMEIGSNLIDELVGIDTPGKLQTVIKNCCNRNETLENVILVLKNWLYEKRYFLDEVLQVNEKWHEILGEKIDLFDYQHYIELGNIISPPKLSNKICGNVAAVLPYVRQKVNMWGVDILRAENFKSLVVYDEYEEASSGESNDKKKNRLSRFDCIATLFASAECIVAQDIFQTLSQFPIAFPLLIPELDEKEKYKVMLPLFTGSVIEWKTSNGTIVKNHLFKDSFKMIVAIRIGENSKGKSTIINQLLNPKYMFTSCSEPKAEYGIPYMASGSIEFIWLTEETCGYELWNLVFKNHYAKGGKEIILLANLHGDALDYPDQIELVKQFPSCFLVYLMPEYDETQDKVRNLINTKNVIYNYVDPRRNSKVKKYTIDANLLEKYKTIEKVCKTFEKALDFELPTEPININELKLGKTLQFAGSNEFHESVKIVNSIKKKGCSYFKSKIMQLQKKLFNDLSEFWKEEEFKESIQLFVNILKLPIIIQNRALAHLEREISRLSMEESSESRNNAILKRKELNNPKFDQEKDKKIRKEITNLWKEVDNKNLSIEDFFRGLRHIYEIYKNFTSYIDDDSNSISINGLAKEDVLNLPEYCAELLIYGNTIELLDGHSTTISKDWFLEICNFIDKKFQNLRVFVISILGLQSSGKSTLLNALFSCKFAVSTERCSKGFFMQLLFLEKDLSDMLGVDAFILIDTEGLGASEKKGESESEKRDQMLATVATGISNLIIINILGESISELTEILQIVQTAIVTNAHLKKFPDIRVVQHVTEKDETKSSMLKKIFYDVLKKALETENNSNMTIENEGCFRLFAPFKNGATAYSTPSKQYHEDVVELYKSIINGCKDPHNKQKFSDWYSQVISYWDTVSNTININSSENKNSLWMSLFSWCIEDSE
ncbi:1478_t:CDS:2 [Dentiscutata heterogama]|uniref:1478_t:CDS:1 n=1 Tax=Dentiscutata heterogama TaxID=1316150 RepID=A0ACA9LEQ6_9GLOM|nr:1478_t:CDS:2 [Dentiscutata heterogama]